MDDRTREQPVRRNVAPRSDNQDGNGDAITLQEIIEDWRWRQRFRKKIKWILPICAAIAAICAGVLTMVSKIIELLFIKR